MKKQLLAIALLHTAVYAHAQTPNAIPYQAAARTSSGAVIASQPVGVRFTVRDSTATGAVLYSETHTPTTTAQGLFTVQIGQGTPVSGTFSSINWGHNAKYLQVELDATGGTTYTHIGTQQLLSVPYALYAETAGGSNGWADSAGLLHNTNTTGRVGIGTSAPAARLHVADSSVVFTGKNENLTLTPDPWDVSIYGATPVNGRGSRMMWYADMGAFRAGYVDSNQWDKHNIGLYSTSTGYNSWAFHGIGNIAMGYNAYVEGGFGNVAMGNSTGVLGCYQGGTAMGWGSIAEGLYGATAIGSFCEAGWNSTAMGDHSIANGAGATSLGSGCLASGLFSTAIGVGSTASGDNGSIALGLSATASGAMSAAINGAATGAGSIAINGYATGNTSTAVALGLATGDYAIAIGNGEASGDYSTTLGHYISTNYKTGAFAIGDGNTATSVTENDADNQMMMRFSGGYKLYNDTFATKGLHITPAGPVKYLTNVTALFDDRSLVDKHYVDSVAAGGSTAGNWAAAGTDVYNTNTGRIGIGTSTPKARLHVADSSVVFTGFYNTDDPYRPFNDVMWSLDMEEQPVSGPGSRMMWCADKSAFRAGTVFGDEWNQANIGMGSIALGIGAKAHGNMSTAIGGMGLFTLQGPEATDMATAIGCGAIASGSGSTAIGGSPVGVPLSSGVSSVALGVGAEASGDYSFAIISSNASGFNSIAMRGSATGSTAVAIGGGVAEGDNSTALGNGATAIGTNAMAIGMGLASGNYSTTLGHNISTNEKTGAFAIGDYSSEFTSNDADNQMIMRFAGGYKLYSDASATVGVALDPSSNSWSVISDKRKKENFRPIDGNGILKKIGTMPLTSWNYKGQDPKTYRHYGPMAQDFYAAFGNDGVGSVGNDTTINQADMAGVTFAAVQAMVKKVEELTKQNEQLAKQNAGFIKHITNLEKQSVQCSNDNEILKAELQKTKSDVDSRLEQMEMMIRQQQTAKK